MMKKHLHNSLRALFLSLAVLLSLPMLALTVEKNGIYYEVDGRQATVVQPRSGEYAGSIRIPETVGSYTVTSIGNGAFAHCSGLTSVYIPNSVESIGNGAFAYCSGLTSVTIGNGVESIGNQAFEGCSGLSSVYIPNSVKSIGAYAFAHCSGLTSVTIPNSVTSIGVGTFSNCSGLASVTIPNSVKSIGDYAFLNCYGLTSVTIPNSVTSIGVGAFSGCSGLASVTIPNSVTSIENDAFVNCSGLTSVTIGNSVTSIGQLAFANCSQLLDVYCYAKNVPTTLQSNAFNGSYTKNPTLHVPAGSIESYRKTEPWSGFENIVAISTEINGIRYVLNAETTQATVVAKSSDKYSGSIVIPESVTHESTTYSVTSIGMDAFEGCTGLTSVTIPNNVTSIGRWAFSGCSGLTSLTIPNSVKSIGTYAFSGCSGLTSVHISDIAAWCNIDFEDYSSNPLHYAHHLYLNGVEVKDLVIPNSVTSIGYDAFYGCSGLTSVTIGNGVESIGNQAFYGCSGLTSVTIPNSVTSIGEKAFANCSELLDVYCYAKNVPSTGSNAFDGSYTKNPTLHVPAGSVDRYTENAPWSGFENIVAISTEINGIRYVLNAETTQATVIAKSSGKYSGSIVIPESVTHESTAYSVTSIGKNAFRDCSGLTSVTIGNSVASIGNYAFYGCSGLNSVHISDIIAWCNIDFGGEFSNPLSYATLLYLNGEEVKELEIPNNVTSIGEGAFSNCSGLTSVTIPNSVTSIGEGAFLGCSGLTSVTIPNSVESIGDKAFLGCSGLTSVTIPNSVTSIGSGAFSGSGLTSVTIPNNVTSIGHTAFSNCSDLTSVTIGNGVTSIEWGAFLGCSGLTSVTIPNSVESIGISAFNGCSALTSVSIPNSVTSIGSSAFEGCSDLTSVHISDIIAWCNIEFGDSYSNPLYNAHHLYLNEEEVKDLVIPNSVTSIKNYSFFGCSGLTSVTIPNSVTSIGDNAFYDCSGLTSVTIGNSVESIGYQAFCGCSGLTSVSIPNSVTSIGREAFAGCSGLSSVTIGNGVESIGEHAFANCSELTDVYCYAENVPSTESNAFEGLDQENATLHVPAGSVERYRTIEPWSSFRKIFAISIEVDGISYVLNAETTQATVVANSSGKYSDEVVIPESVTHEGTAYRVTSIGDHAFLECSGLTSVNIPNSVTSIGYQAFSLCSGLTSVTIGNSVESIEPEAFYGCSGLTSVTIPNSVTSIGYQAFCYCSGLTSVTIPNSVTSIGINAFSYCKDLTSVTIGNGVESIGQLAFANCPELLDVYCYAENVPTTESNAFEGLDLEFATLHVPAGSVDRYTATAPWRGFGKIVGLSKEYSLTVSSVGYATLYLDFNAEIPEAVKAYVAKEVVDDRLKMERVEGVLPANTGVVIMAEEGKYDFVWTDAAPATIEVNLFEGTAQQAEIEAQDGTTYYVLSAPDGVVGMYPVKLTNGMFPCMANKAYLPLVSEASARICFDFGTETGIVETENGELKTENCYDLAGRKVQGVQKGIYIVGGKKVLR